MITFSIFHDYLSFKLLSIIEISMTEETFFPFCRHALSLRNVQLCQHGSSLGFLIAMLIGYLSSFEPLIGSFYLRFK